MFGRHYDTRPMPTFVHTYSKVPYLDTEIFNIQMEGLRQSRRTRQRTCKALENLERAREKSERLSEGLRDSRKRCEEDQKKFIANLNISQQNRFQQEEKTWKEFNDEKELSRINYLKDSAYLNELMQTNATKAASRIVSVRRWY